jgi:hypothetical protein
MGEFCLLYLLCMLLFPVPLQSLHALRDPTCLSHGFSVCVARDRQLTSVAGVTAAAVTATEWCRSSTSNDVAAAAGCTA